MTSRPKWASDPTIRLVACCCALIAVMDISVRVFPDLPSQNEMVVKAGTALFKRQLPSRSWRDWHNAMKSAEAEQLAALEAENKRIAEQNRPPQSSPPPKPEIDDQQGDLEVLRVNGFDYQIWGVFNKLDGDRDDVFVVLKSKGGRSLQIRKADSVGKYRVTSISERSVSLESTVDDRQITLWMFGKGPR